MRNVLYCYVRYTKSYILIFIPDIIYKKKHNLKKYDEKYLYQKIINDCKKDKKDIIDILKIYSNKKIKNFDCLYDDKMEVSHTLLEDIYIKTFIDNYKIKMVDNIIEKISH